MTDEIPIIGFAAYSGTGKTTLLEKLLQIFSQRGLRVGVIKHAHHNFAIDHAGKDSHRFRQAGACQVLIGTENRWAMIVEAYHEEQFKLNDHIRQMRHSKLDLILVEGFKRADIPKIELTRPALGNPLLFPDDASIIAVATDDTLATVPALAVLDINDAKQIVDFINQRFLNEDDRKT